MAVYYEATQPKITLSHEVEAYPEEFTKDNKFKKGVYQTFSTSSSNRSGTGLQSYNFSRSTKDLVGNFSFTIREDATSDGNMFLDNVRVLDVVKIYEHDMEKPTFIGIVNNISFGAIAGAMNKIVTISGKSIESLFDMYKLSLDVTAMSLIQGSALNVDFIDKLLDAEYKTVEKTEKVEIKPVDQKSLKDAKDNLVMGFQQKNFSRIKNAYNYIDLSAAEAIKTLRAATFEILKDEAGNTHTKDEYIAGMLACANTTGVLNNIANNIGFSVSKVTELKGLYLSVTKTMTETTYKDEVKKVQVVNNDPMSVKEFLNKLLCYIEGIMKAHSQIGTTEIFTLLKSYYDIDDTSSTTSYNIKNINCDIKFKYPIFSNVFTNSTIKIFDYLKNLLPTNVYEMFGIIEDGKPKIVIREMPFGDITQDENKNIKCDEYNNPIPNYKTFLSLYKSDYDIPASLITDYTVSLSNEQVYTAFLSYLEGSSLSSQQYLVMDSTEIGYKTAIENIKKMGVYGYNLMNANFLGYHGYEVSKPEEEETISKQFTQTNYKLQIWYGKLDEMYTGDVTVVNVKDMTFPSIGEVLKLCGGYFYITSESHSWRYGDVPKINYKLDRGGVYKEDGFQRLTGISKQYAELDK